MRILLFGANGQLGHAVRKELAHHEITPIAYPEADITQLEAMQRTIERFAPDLVLNAAGYTDVDGAEQQVELAYRVNALGPRNLALSTKKTGIPLLHVSTDYVFDGEKTSPYHEWDRPNPLSVYGASKLAGEEAVRNFNDRHYIVRTAWLFHTVGNNFVRTMYGLAAQPEVRVVCDQVGSPTFAPHLAKAMGRLIAQPAYGTYHLAGSGMASWYELTKVLYEALDTKTMVTPVPRSEFPRPARRPKFSALMTIQDPFISLPPWEEGVKAFASELHACSPAP